MKEYVKPTVDLTEDYAEGVYAASGSTAESETGAAAGSGTAGEIASAEAVAYGAPKCDSVYMNGVWQAGDYSDWAGGTRGYKDQFGCKGCPANTGSGCGLGDEHYGNSGYAASYDTDNGDRKPTWEKKGYGPNDIVRDWAM